MTDRPKYSCQGCTRDDLSLTANGKVRSHAANGKRVGPDNPACGMGSEYPLENTKFHTHNYTYADGEIGHSGSFCDCGLAEQDAPEPPAAPVPPNPFRDPLPGGVWDSVPQPEPVQPAGPVGADDFLDGADDDYAEAADDGGPSYWPARYDGECISCFAHFDEGDLIRKSDGGYEAKECCGQGAAPQPDRPKSVARTLPVVRGRYKLPDPETGKPLTASRSSKFAEGIADSYALDQWRHRMILVGVVQDPEILDKVSSGIRDFDPLDAVKQRREFLNRRADEAMTAAGGDDRSSKGTKLHKFTEEVDAGTRALADVPKDYRPDAAAYVHALNNCGFRPVKGLIERSVFCRDLNVCGTFDRVLECVRTTDVLDLDGRMVTIRAGEFVIGDVKSGDNIKNPWLEILIQESIYAHAINENGIAVQDTPGGPFRWEDLSTFGVTDVREDVGIVMHVPFGQAEAKLYFADLIIGWRGALLCKANKEFWKIELPHVPVASYSVDPDDIDPDTLMTAPEAVVESEIDYEQGEEPEEPGHRVNALSDAVQEERELDPEDVRRATRAWGMRFSAARTREKANDLWREAKDADLPGWRIKELVAMVKLEDPAPADQHDPKSQTAVSGPGSSRRDEPVAETGGSRQTATGGQDGPSLTERAHAVTTKAEASAVWHEAKAKIDDLPEEKRQAAREYLTKLEQIMRVRLAPTV